MGDQRSVTSPSRRIRRLALIVPCLIGLFFSCMVAVYAIPERLIEPNVRASSQLLVAEGRFGLPLTSALAYDNDTEAIMLDLNVAQPDKSPLRSAMGPVKNGAKPGGDAVQALQEVLETGVRPRPIQYSYYWHGYQVVLRPALVLLDYPGLRYLNFTLLAALGTWVALRIRHVLGAVATVAFVGSLVLASFFVVPMQLGYSIPVYLMLVGILAVLGPAPARLHLFDLEIFLLLGMFTAYFEFLMAPLLTLGMPLVVALILRSRLRTHSPRRELVYSLVISLVWSAGYLGTWLCKIAIGSVVLKQDVWAAFREQLLVRSGLDAQNAVELSDAFAVNLVNLAPVPPLTVVVVLFAIAVGILSLRFHVTSDHIRRAASPLLAVPLPYAWFLIASQHSAQHFYYTYRIQAIALFAVGYFVLALVDWERLNAAMRGLVGRVLPTAHR